MESSSGIHGLHSTKCLFTLNDSLNIDFDLFDGHCDWHNGVFPK